MVLTQAVLEMTHLSTACINWSRSWTGLCHWGKDSCHNLVFMYGIKVRGENLVDIEILRDGGPFPFFPSTREKERLC